MLISWMPLFTVAFYCFLTLWLAWSLQTKQLISKANVIGMSAVAFMAHAVLLYHWIDLPSGQNLSFFNVFSQVAWFIVLIWLLAVCRKPVETLGIFVYPLAAISVLLAWQIPGENIIQTGVFTKELFHIMISMITFSVLCIAALQSILLALEEKLLRQKRLVQFITVLPPLETMEHILFQMIWLGFALLSLVLLTSLTFFHDILSIQVLQKTVLTLIAWVVFLGLLFGRYYFGWRGKVAIKGTLIGVICLMLLLVISYYGTYWILKI